MYACMYMCMLSCVCGVRGRGVEGQVNGLMYLLLFQEVEGRIEEVANSLKNSIKDKDRGASSLKVSLSFAQCIHHSNPTSPLSLSPLVCAPLQFLL